ncbi:MAG: 50S ribosomal protein L24, partial [Deltaproteobacteria bacterium RBG_13_65_10]
MASAKSYLRKNDTVVVIAGKERGKTGKILRLIPAKSRVIVEKINMVKRHQRPTGVQKQGGIVAKEAPLHVSNVLIRCPKCNAGRRVGCKILE